ncbi:MAG: 4'-phosphopantetheinyl transferase superfamily protein [bacterium]
MADPTLSESSRRSVTRLQWSSPFPPGIAFSGVVESRADESSVGGGGVNKGGVDEGEVDSTRHRLLPEERAILPETVHPRRLLEFTLGRGCARVALASLDPSLGCVPILRSGNRTPRWPEGYVGAITHHKGRAAAAVAREGDYAGLGLDLEARRAMSDGMRRRLLRPEERARLEGLPEAEADLRAMIVFSTKESIYKCLQPVTGIYLGFQDAEVFEVAEDSPGSGTLRWRLRKDCGPRFPAGYEGVGAYALQPGFVLTGVWVAA